MAMGFRHIISPPQTWNNGNVDGDGEVKRTKITARKSTNSALNRKTVTDKQIEVQHISRMDTVLSSKVSKMVPPKENISIASIGNNIRPVEQSSVRIVRWDPTASLDSSRSVVPKVGRREQELSLTKNVPSVKTAVESSRSDLPKTTLREQSTLAKKTVERPRSDAIKGTLRELLVSGKIGSSRKKMLESATPKATRREQFSLDKIVSVAEKVLESPRTNTIKGTLRELLISAKIGQTVESSQSDTPKTTRRGQSCSAKTILPVTKTVESSRSDTPKSTRRGQYNSTKAVTTLVATVESDRWDKTKVISREQSGSSKTRLAAAKTIESSRSDIPKTTRRGQTSAVKIVPSVVTTVKSDRSDMSKVTSKEKSNSSKVLANEDKGLVSPRSETPKTTRRGQTSSFKVVPPMVTAVESNRSDMSKIALKEAANSSKVIVTLEKGLQLSRSESVAVAQQREDRCLANVIPNGRTTMVSDSENKSVSEKSCHHGNVGQTYSRPRLNGQIRHARTRVLRSLKPKRVLMLERLKSSYSPSNINGNEVDCHQMLPVSKEIQERNLIDIAAKFDDSLSLPPPISSSFTGRSSKSPTVKRNVDEVLQNIPANMANLRLVPFVKLNLLKPVSELRKFPNLRSGNVARSSEGRESRTNCLSPKQKKVAPSNPQEFKEETMLRSSPVSLNSSKKDTELIVEIKEEPTTPPVTPCIEDEELVVEDPFKSGDWNNISYSPCKLPKRTGRNGSHFFGKYAYMVGKQVSDPGKKHRRYVSRRLSTRGRKFGRRIRSFRYRARSWRSNQQKRIRMSCPDIDVIDGIEFLSFESDEDLKRFIRNNPGRVCKGPSRIDLERLRQRSASGQPIIPTKTNDITKIKGWRNKVFDPEAISTLDHILKNLRRRQVRNVVFKKQMFGLPSCSSGSSTSIDFNDNYVDHHHHYQYDDTFLYDEDTKYSLNWIRDYEESVFDGVEAKHEVDDVNNDNESIKSVDLGILSSECIDEELRKRDQQEDNVDIRTLSRESFISEDVTNKEAIFIPSIKSAFVSDFLNDFLKNQSELKVKLPEPIYVSPADIDTKVVWPSHEMAVLDQVPTIPEVPRNVLQPTFRQRRVMRPGVTNRIRPRGRGRPPRSGFVKSQIEPNPSTTASVSVNNTTKTTSQKREPIEMVTISLKQAVFAVKTLHKRFIFNKHLTNLATAKQIERALNKPSTKLSSCAIKSNAKKCVEFSVIISPLQSAIAASALVEPESEPKRVNKVDSSEEGLDAWERFLRTTSTNGSGQMMMMSSSPDAKSGHEEETSSLACDTTTVTLSEVVTSSDAISPDSSFATVRTGGGGGDCDRDFCRLGCVCDSLKVRKRRRGHCGKVQCMFSCSCNPFDERELTSRENKNVDAEEIHLPKRRRQIRIPARLKDSVYFYGGDRVEKDLGKNVQSTSEEKYKKYKMKTKEKQPPKVTAKPQAKTVERTKGTPLQQIKPKLNQKEYVTTFAKLSAAEVRAYSKLGHPKNSNSTTTKDSRNVSEVKSMPNKQAMDPPSSAAVAAAVPTTPTKHLRLEFTFKPMAPIVRPASSRSIPTILRRSGTQTARKSLNPSSQYQSVPSNEQSQTGTVEFKKFVESNEKVENIVKNLLQEMVRKVAFREEVPGSLQNQIIQRARMSCFGSSVLPRGSSLPVTSDASAAAAVSETPSIRFPVSMSLLNMEKRQVACSSTEASATKPPTEKVKLSKEEKEQNRRKELRLAFTHLAMVACPVVKDMWSQRNRSFSITAFVFRMACTAIGRLRQQEKKLILSKQSLIRERMELFNKYTEYLKGLDAVKQKQTIKELANRLQLCCRERNQRNKDNDEQQKKANSATFTSTVMQNIVKKPTESQPVSNWIPVSSLACSDRLRSEESSDDVSAIDLDLPSAVPSKFSDPITNVAVGDPIGKVGNKPILLGDSVMIGGSYAACLRPTRSEDVQDGGSMKTIRLNSQKGAVKWISLQSNPTDSEEQDSLKESNVSVTDLVRKPPNSPPLPPPPADVQSKSSEVIEVFKKPSILNESIFSVTGICKKPPMIKESDNAVTVKSDNYISAFFQRLRASKKLNDSSSSTKVTSVTKKTVFTLDEAFNRAIAARRRNNSMASLLNKLPRNTKTNDSMVALMNKLSATKNMKDSMVVSAAQKPCTTKKSNDTVIVFLEKPAAAKKTNDSVAVGPVAIEKSSATKNTSNSVGGSVIKPSAVKNTEDSPVVPTDKPSTTKKTMDSIIVFVEKPPTAKKTNELVPVAIDMSSAAKSTNNPVRLSVIKPCVAKKADDCVSVSVEKSIAINTNDFVVISAEKSTTDQKMNDSVAEPIDSQSEMTENDDSLAERVKTPSNTNQSNDSKVGPTKNLATVAVKIGNSDTVTYLPTKSPSGNYLTVADMLKIAHREAKDSGKSTTSSSNSTSNSNIVSSPNSAIVSSLQPETAVNQITIMKSASNGSLVAVRPDKDAPPLLIGVVPTTTAPSRRTLTLASSIGSSQLSILEKYKKQKIMSNLVAPHTVNRFVVIKPKPYSMVIEQQMPLPVVPRVSKREQSVVSPVDDAPLNIEDIPRRKRKSVAILLRQQKDAERAAARAVASKVEASCQSQQQQPIIMPLRATYPQEASLLRPVNTFLGTPISVPAVSIGVDGVSGGVQHLGTEIPKMLFSPITEDDFLHGKDVS